LQFNITLVDRGRGRAGGCDWQGRGIRILFAKLIVLVFDAIHAADEDADIKRVRQHRLAHQRYASGEVVRTWSMISTRSKDLLSGGKLGWKNRLETERSDR